MLLLTLLLGIVFAEPTNPGKYCASSAEVTNGGNFYIAMMYEETYQNQQDNPFDDEDNKEIQYLHYDPAASAEDVSNLLVDIYGKEGDHYIFHVEKDESGKIRIKSKDEGKEKDTSVSHNGATRFSTGGQKEDLILSRNKTHSFGDDDEDEGFYMYNIANSNLDWEHSVRHLFVYDDETHTLNDSYGRRIGLQQHQAHTALYPVGRTTIFCFRAQDWEKKKQTDDSNYVNDVNKLIVNSLNDANADESTKLIVQKDAVKHFRSLDYNQDLVNEFVKEALAKPPKAKFEFLKKGANTKIRYQLAQEKKERLAKPPKGETTKEDKAEDTLKDTLKDKPAKTPEKQGGSDGNASVAQANFFAVFCLAILFY